MKTNSDTEKPREGWLTIGIVSCSDKESVRRSLLSVLASGPSKADVLLADCTPTADLGQQLCMDFPDAKVRTLAVSGGNSSACRQAVLDAARTEFIVFLLAGWELAPGCLSLLWDVLRQDAALGCVTAKPLGAFLTGKAPWACAILRRGAATIAGGFPHDLSPLAFHEQLEVEQSLGQAGFATACCGEAKVSCLDSAEPARSSQVFLWKTHDLERLKAREARRRRHTEAQTAFLRQGRPLRVLLLCDPENPAEFLWAEALQALVLPEVTVQIQELSQYFDGTSYDLIVTGSTRCFGRVHPDLKDGGKLILGHGPKDSLEDTLLTARASGCAMALAFSRADHVRLRPHIRTYCCQHGVSMAAHGHAQSDANIASVIWIGATEDVADTVRRACADANIALRTVGFDAVVSLSSEQRFDRLFRNATIVLGGFQEETPAPLILEALACGLPVLAPPLGIIPEIIIDGFNGALVPDRQSLSRALQAVLEMDSANLSANCRETVAQGWTWEQQARKYKHMFRDAYAAHVSGELQMDPVRAPLKIASNYATSSQGINVGKDSEFAKTLQEFIRRIRPKHILETGTYHGDGTTAAIARALREMDCRDAEFYTIEINPDNYSQALANLAQSGLLPYVRPLNGLSVPRNLLPDRDRIQNDLVVHCPYEGIFVDHEERDRSTLYYEETNFDEAPDDLIGICLLNFNWNVDFVLLDSAGHIGFIEFNYIIDKLRSPCYIALDDTQHVKHHKSYLHILNDKRFELLVDSNEKFGFCLARFTPKLQLPAADTVQRLLYVRPDAIGDAILASAMLPRLAARFPHASIGVVCQEHVAPLYEACPHAVTCLAFNRKKVLEDETALQELMGRIRAFQPDLVLNSVYSPDLLAMLLSMVPHTPAFGLDGDCSNCTQEQRDMMRRQFSGLAPTQGKIALELDRHRDFLQFLEADGENLDPVVWLSDADMAEADALFRKHDLLSDSCIALFAGVQFDSRIYNRYGEALVDCCQRLDLSVVAFGAQQDYQINNLNLQALQDAGVKTVNLSGQLGLRTTAACLSRCRLAVGAETGLAHMACAVGTPNVILLGGGHFGRFMPYSWLTSAVSLPLECFGCNWQCKYSEYHCVRGVCPEIITQAVFEALDTVATGFPRLYIQRPSAWSRTPQLPRWRTPHAAAPLRDVDIIPAVAVSPQNSTESALHNGTNPLVTVIVPTYNRPEFLIRALQSIVKQTFKDFEVVVVNDCGIQIEKVVNLFSHLIAIRSVRNEQNIGLAASRNVGLSLARGKYISYLDDDDAYYSDHLSKLVEAMESSNFHVVYSDAHRAVQKKFGSIYKTVSKDVFYSFDFSNELILKQNITPVTCIMHKKSCIDAVGYFDENLHAHEDWDLWVRMSRIFPFKHIKKVTCEFTWRDDGTSMTIAKKKIMDETRAYVMGEANIYGQFKPVYELLSIANEHTVIDIKKYPSEQCIVSIIIPVFNKLTYTRQCIEAILKDDTIQYEIIVVDNGSTDNTREYLQTINANIKIISNKENVGFTIACNQGARIALGDYIVFLNNDTTPQFGWLKELVKTAKRDPTIGAVGSKLVFPDGKLQEAGCLIFSDGTAYRFGNMDDPNAKQYNEVIEVDYCSAACLLVVKEIFDRIGGFDIRFSPAYAEDSDLCFSIRALGYKVLYCPTAVIQHHENITAGKSKSSALAKIAERKFAEKWKQTLVSQDKRPSSSQKVTSADRKRLAYLCKECL